MPRRLLQFALLAFLVATAVSVPAGAANREHQQMVADIRMLQEQTQQLQVQLGALADALKTVTSKLDEQAGTSRKAFADQKLLADNIANDLRVVREKVDDNNVRLGSVQQEIESIRLGMPSSAIPATPPSEQPAGVPPPGGAPAVPAAGGAPPGVSPQRLYESAWGDYTAGQWGLAIEGFESYLKMFPKSERAADAQYYVGKAYLQDGKFEQARIAFDKVIADFSRSPNVSSAYYYRGQALENMGQPALARESYDHVLKSYPPEDPAVGLAKQALDRLAKARKDNL